eukprot:768473-Hanusia_phi.AAC.24
MGSCGLAPTERTPGAVTVSPRASRTFQDLSVPSLSTVPGVTSQSHSTVAYGRTFGRTVTVPRLPGGAGDRVGPGRSSLSHMIGRVRAESAARPPLSDAGAALTSSEGQRRAGQPGRASSGS